MSRLRTASRNSDSRESSGTRLGINPGSDVRLRPVFRSLCPALTFNRRVRAAPGIRLSIRLLITFFGVGTCAVCGWVEGARVRPRALDTHHGSLPVFSRYTGRRLMEILLNSQETSLLSAFRRLPPDAAVELSRLVERLAALAPDRKIDWSDSWSDEDLRE
jgi:hypothetical protein